MKIILLGAPGSGKGTQGELMTKTYAFPRISTGDLLRDAVSRRTPLGKQAKTIMERGDLIADDLVVKMLEDINRSHQEVVIEIYLPDEVVIERLSARRICSDCGTIYNVSGQKPRFENICDVCSGNLIQRDDDKPGVIDERLRVYHEQTEPLVDFYKAKTSYIQIDGEGTVEEVFARVRDVIDEAIDEAKV
jgi:adenylate kinase